MVDDELPGFFIHKAFVAFQPVVNLKLKVGSLQLGLFFLELLVNGIIA